MDAEKSEVQRPQSGVDGLKRKTSDSGRTTRDTGLESDDICWCCSGRTVMRHCKIVCTNCGFMRDCSDP
jgi:hypothetical protein